jgi:acetylglutamate kinase
MITPSPFGEGWGEAMSKTEKEDLYIIKIGGNVIDNSENLYRFLKDFTGLKGYKILVHGGGKVATELLKELGIEVKMVDGRRITDIETLRVVTMVYAGLINKNIVAQLQRFGTNAIGLTGADGDHPHQKTPGESDRLRSCGRYGRKVYPYRKHKKVARCRIYTRFLRHNT